MLSVPITLAGKTASGAFSEETLTTVINAHGALIGLTAKVTKGQIVSIKTKHSPEEQECRVIWIGPTAEGKAQCGIEFVKPAPNFWRVSFPPSDWSPSSAPVMAGSKVKQK